MLSPILFLIYVYNLVKLRIENCGIVSFANETALISSELFGDKIFKCAEKGILTVKKWLDKNILTLNLSKPSYLTLFPDFRGQPPNCKKLKCDASTCASAHKTVNVHTYLRWTELNT